MTKCFLCKNEYENTVVNLGDIYPSLFLDKPEDKVKFDTEELALAQCPKCEFVQLTNVLEPDNMYREYWYRSGLNNTMVTALQDIVTKSLAKSPQSYKRVMDIGCFPSDTKIRMSDYSTKNIQDIKEGDYVLTPNNKECKVLKTFTRKYTGKIYNLSTMHGFNLSATEEHPILNDKLEYKQIKDFKKGEYVSIPRIKSSKNLQIDKDRLLIYGWFLAEGSYIHSHKPLICGINLCLGIHEEHYIKQLEDASKRLGLNTTKSIRPEKNTIDLRIYSKDFATEVKRLFGEYSHHKFINKEIYNWSDECKIELIKHYMRGDGHLRYMTSGGYQYIVTSVSKELIYGIKQLLIQLGISTNIHFVNDSYRLTISGQKISLLEPGIIEEDKDRCLYKTNDNFIFVRVKNNSFEEVENINVYNFEVEDENAYIANNIGVHNCNDGTLLSFYPDKFFKTGYDPANNLAGYAINNCDIFINNYFDDSIHYSLPFDIITSIAMFYDLEDPDKFIRSIKKYLCKSGIWVVQMTDLMCTIKTNAYDNICFEHIGYYTLEVMKKLLAKHDMEIFDLEYNDVNGASVRLYIQHIGAQRGVTFTALKAMEDEKEIFKLGYWEKFNEKIAKINQVTTNFINEINKCGKTVFGLGASTKGNTFLQMCNLTNKDIPYILEVSKDKFGKYAIGSDIPIISETEGFIKEPDFLLILPWHFTNFFLKRHVDYLKRGGKFLVAMPEPGYWSWDDSKEEPYFTPIM